jgi:hypothetical protein
MPFAAVITAEEVNLMTVEVRRLELERGAFLRRTRAFS